MVHAAQPDPEQRRGINSILDVTHKQKRERPAEFASQ